MEVKEKIFEFIKNNKKNIIIGVSILLVLIIPITIFLKDNEKESNDKQIVYSDIEKKDNVESIIEEFVYVDIKGMVKNPGIYKMNSSDRVNDVIIDAGGLLKGANTRYINLSKKVSDEMVIVIYSESEIEEKLSVIDKVDEVPCLCESSINESCLINESVSEISEEQNSRLININTATKENLMTLPGIGESKAEDIIEYRNSTKFEKIEDIKEVSGIGESIFSKIKDLITTE